MSGLTCEQAATLISGFMDNELTQQQQQQLHHHLAECAGCQSELKELQGMREQLRNAIPKFDDGQLLAKFDKDKPSRWVFIAGWVLVLTTLSLLAIYGIFSYWSDESIPMALKLVTSSLGLGFLLLFGAVARQRWIAAKNDRYKKVQL
ncbi:hypothetical protein CWI76_02395 [Pseudidiomarina marina]|uniref:Putative zinc-finger domain-containing protein n=2 Tax=Pseudidiomarina marina TaxID=502366 RepID=A0A432YJQ8_9GAMM|nr:zf-HC2 domain-containing protein [Pseudidiomarina marina]RUO61138.1 hypothetical protein CWI76_02395 [Pseudidiomarina marina]